MNASRTHPSDAPNQLDSPIPLSADERNLLVAGSLRLLLGRLDRGMPVHADDLIRIASYAHSNERTAA